MFTSWPYYCSNSGFSTCAIQQRTRKSGGQHGTAPSGRVPGNSSTAGAGHFTATGQRDKVPDDEGVPRQDSKFIVTTSSHPTYLLLHCTCYYVTCMGGSKVRPVYSVRHWHLERLTTCTYILWDSKPPLPMPCIVLTCYARWPAVE